ncbi:hypothetical protein Ciccas_002631 [Cichlidogyrus casuarinus]|uniref:Uncharacterized protein n=1 Tax=Cichlidogyrus casuarinus TaxID=1844966 RepID=A0ABD2QJX2_9PLAT
MEISLSQFLQFFTSNVSNSTKLQELIPKANGGIIPAKFQLVKREGQPMIALERQQIFYGVGSKATTYTTVMHYVPVKILSKSIAESYVHFESVQLDYDTLSANAVGRLHFSVDNELDMKVETCFNQLKARNWQDSGTQNDHKSSKFVTVKVDMKNFLTVVFSQRKEPVHCIFNFIDSELLEVAIMHERAEVKYRLPSELAN